MGKIMQIYYTVVKNPCFARWVCERERALKNVRNAARIVSEMDEFAMLSSGIKSDAKKHQKRTPKGSKHHQKCEDFHNGKLPRQKVTWTPPARFEPDVGRPSRQIRGGPFSCLSTTGLDLPKPGPGGRRLPPAVAVQRRFSVFLSLYIPLCEWRRQGIPCVSKKLNIYFLV